MSRSVFWRQRKCTPSWWERRKGGRSTGKVRREGGREGGKEEGRDCSTHF
jgi:hypothetical protein